MSSMIERLGTATSEPIDLTGNSGRSLGRLLLDAGKITTENAERALKHAKDKNVRFGEACIQLKLVKEEDIERALSMQFDYPYLQPGETALSSELVSAYRPFSPQVEGLRTLRTQLLLRWFSSERRVLAIVSQSRGDGRSFIAANLAVVFSQLGERTLLIDADMRHPRQHVLFNVSNQYGLSSALSGRAGGLLGENVKGFVNLSVIPAGAAPPNPLELLSRREFSDLLAAKSGAYEVIIIDSPAGGQYADAQAISARAGGALLVAREGVSRVRELERLTGSVRQTDSDFVGCVLNKH
jgi:chain length determinant protein tyrosine kinase EpsG